MRVFHWNMTPPPTSRTSQRQKWRAGFACEGAAAYMGLTWRATNSLTICSELRARKSGEIEMRLVRLGRNGPGVSEMRLGCMGMSGGYGHAATRNPYDHPCRARGRHPPCWIVATFTARDKRLTAAGGRWFGKLRDASGHQQSWKAKGEPLDMTVWPQDGLVLRFSLRRMRRREVVG